MEDFTDEELLEQQLLEEQLREEQQARRQEQANILQRRGEKQEQDVLYLESLFTDQMKGLRAEREKQRRLIADLLRTKLPTNIMDLIPIEQQRLLRIRDQFLTPEEREYVREIKEEIERLEQGGCYDGQEGPDLFKVRIPGVALALCFDIYDIFEQGLVNEDLGLADVNIDIGETGEMYRYPLSDEEVQQLIKQARGLNIDFNQYPRLSFPNIEETRDKLFEAYAE